MRYQGLTLEVRRGNEVIACVTPPTKVAGFPIDQLDALLSSAPALSDVESREFLRDIHEATDRLVAEGSAWDLVIDTDVLVLADRRKAGLDLARYSEYGDAFISTITSLGTAGGRDRHRLHGAVPGRKLARHTPAP
ncbi:MAG: hypothetical protein MZW92_38455 [Comamonadaceae bacterium]|nr:hypothetical protein [Comamonadaceae bacterium]